MNNEIDNCEKNHKHFIKNHVIIGLSASKNLTESICKSLKILPGEVQIGHFADGEIYVRSDISLRKKDVILIQSTSKPVNENLMELLIAIDSVKRASANSITVLIPYYSYARQDRKDRGREPISSKLIADLLTKAGATRIALTDVHSEQIQGFFDIPVDTLRASEVILCHLLCEYNKNNLTIVSPDYGGVKRARRIAESLNVPLAIVDKRRPKPNVAESINVLGDVKNRVCVLVDDIVDTGGTMLAGCKLLKQNGASKIIIMATHGLFNGNAIEKFIKEFNNGNIEAVYISNTIEPSKELKKIPNLKIVSLANFYSNILQCYINGSSVSKIYAEYKTWVQTKNLKKIFKKSFLKL